MKGDVQEEAADVSIPELRELYARSIEAQWPDLDKDKVYEVVEACFDRQSLLKIYQMDMDTAAGRIALRNALNHTIEVANYVNRLL